MKVEEYIKRLYSCGYSVTEAHRTLMQILKEFGMSKVIEYVQDIERDRYMA